MKKQLKKRIGFALAIAGLALAVCTMDGIAHEMLLRAIGVAAFAFGVWLAEAYDFQKKENEQTKCREVHDPYPEEMASIN